MSIILKYRGPRQCNVDAVREHIAPLTIATTHLPVPMRIQAARLALRTNAAVAGYIYDRAPRTIEQHLFTYADRIPDKLNLANRIHDDAY